MKQITTITVWILSLWAITRDNDDYHFSCAALHNFRDHKADLHNVPQFQGDSNTSAPRSDTLEDIEANPFYLLIWVYPPDNASLRSQSLKNRDA